ncbi:helix-turn-helix domain-containing protein [Amycolatopsis sp. H20-H5]|uniref:PucR family transcriptional regulator n=1 Tax=Amycolatopsis sp. H20-H5 TaxID=3046309 RepID=UPI002DBBA37B|nr:helix-turn-helix domain-containing protein [Amycolatopsis sp. H20-H5]MEC3978039.1 helix-turn-helix domain-containing protein [Amycolatopsis sp. H20-H5]
MTTQPTFAAANKESTVDPAADDRSTLGSRSVTTALLETPPAVPAPSRHIRAARPFERSELRSVLPARVAAWFRAHVDVLAAAMAAEIQQSVPEYSLPTGISLEQGIRLAVGQCVERVFAPDSQPDAWDLVFREFGKIEFDEGRTLDCLQSAYRIGGRVAWKHVSAVGRSFGLSTEVVCRCAEAIFAYVDEISALSIEGYAAAQARAAGTIALRRRRLLDMLLTDPSTPVRALSPHAASAQWSLPHEVAVVVLEPRTADRGIDIPVLPSNVLGDFEGREPRLIVADPGRELDDLAGSLRKWRVVVGPTVVLAAAPSSLARARQAMRLLRRGVIADAPVVWCADHLTTLCLYTDETLLKELCVRALAPLAGLTSKQRARLGATLLVWLQSRGSAPEIAAKLRVHPQTVRNHMHRLIELFGARLDNPDDRLDLEIALRAEALHAAS